MMSKTKVCILILTGMLFASFSDALGDQRNRTSRRTRYSEMEELIDIGMLQMEASGILKVDCSESVLELSDGIIWAIANSSFVLPEETQGILAIHVNSLTRGRDRNLFQVDIYKKCKEPEQEDEGFAEETGTAKGEEKDNFLSLSASGKIRYVADQLQEILNAEYDKQQNTYREKLEAAREELEPLEEKMRMLNERERELYAEAGISDLRRDYVLKQIRELEHRKQYLMMEVVESEARHGALQSQITKHSDNIREKLADDPILRELEEVVSLRRQELQAAETLQGQGLEAQRKELSQAKLALSKARIDVETRKQGIRELVGSGAVMQEWVKELADLSMTTVEKEEVFGHIRNRLREFKDRNILELADRYELEIALKKDAVHQSYERTQKAIRDFQSRVQRMQPPSVSVLGGD